MIVQTLTMTISGIQIDIQAAIIIDTSYGRQVSFQHIFFARAIPGGDQYPSNSNFKTLCFKQPCQNGGLCVVVSNSYNCIYLIFVYLLK